MKKESLETLTKIFNLLDEVAVDKIDYAIATEQCIGISTYNVTDYGDEINAKKSVFEEVMNYLAQKISTGEVECMSYKTFYESCID